MVQPALITTRLELDRAFDASHDNPVMIFKHSLRCVTSVMAYQAYLDFLADRDPGEGVLYGLIEVQPAREISDAVVERTGVRHASPQVLLIRDGEVVWSATHWDISKEALEGAFIT